MGKSKNKSKGKKKNAVLLVKANCDKTPSLTPKTEEVKNKNSSLSCAEHVSLCAESELCTVCLDKDICRCIEKKSQSVTDLGEVTRLVQDGQCLTRSLVKLAMPPSTCTSMSSRSQTLRIKNVNREETAKFKSEVSALSQSDACEGLGDVKDDCVQSCTEVKTGFEKLLIASCNQKLEDEAEDHSLVVCGGEQCKRKRRSSVKAGRSFARTLGPCTKQAGAGAAESQDETGKEVMMPSPKVVICPNDCLNLESLIRKSFQDDLKLKPESRTHTETSDAPQDAKSVKAERSSTARNPIVAKNSSIASFLAGFTSHSSVEKEKGPDKPQSCDSASICRDFKVEGAINTKADPSVLPSTDCEDDASDIREHSLLSSIGLVQNISGTEPQSLTESPIVPEASVQSATPRCKKRHKSDRKSTKKKRSVPAQPKQSQVDESDNAVLPQSTGCKSSAVIVKTVKPVKSENKDGKNQIKTETTVAQDVALNLSADTAGAPILTRSMIKTSGSSTGLLLREDASNSRKRRMETREPRQNMRLEQHACLLWSSDQRRRFQQDHPDAKSDELDEIMRNYWRKMSDRDCQRYIQRARNALSDRSGGLRMRFKDPPLCHTSTANHESRVEHSMNGVPFDRQGHIWNSHFDGSAYVLDQRSKAVKMKLKYLQQNLSRFQYQKFISDFQMRLTESQQNAEDAQNLHTQTSNNGDKNMRQQKFSEAALKIMQKMIEDQEKALKFAQYEHKAVKHRRMLQAYEFLISEMVQDTGNWVHEDVESDLLTEILGDLEELEEDEKMLCAKEDSCASGLSDIEEVLKVRALAKSLSSGTFTTTASTEEDSLPSVGDAFYQKVLLYESSCQPSLSQLQVDDIEDCLNGCTSVLEEASDKYLPLLPSDIFLMDALSRLLRQRGGVEPCCELNCPSCILTDLLIAGKLQQLESGLQVDECNPRNEADLEMKPAEDIDSNQRSQLNASQFVINRECSDAYINSSGGPPVNYSQTSKSHSDYGLVPDSELDGIFGVDTWLTAPIVQCPIQTLSAESCAAAFESHIGCEPLGSPALMDIGTVDLQSIRANSCTELGQWAFQEDQDEEFGLMQVLHDSAVHSHV